MMHIPVVDIRFVPPADMRYDTVGDWQVVGGTLKITVADPPGAPATSGLLIAIHELVEAVLCLATGVTEEQVDAWDQTYHGDYEDEPGADPAAPYHREHMMGELVERLVAFALFVDWNAHDAAVAEIAAAVTAALQAKP
jgi:hypothetical protein